MSAHNHGSKKRAGLFSESKFSKWTRFDPFWLEVQAAYKAFDKKIPAAPAFPEIIVVQPAKGFMHPCTRDEIRKKLMKCDPKHLDGLRAVFMLGGTAKQLKFRGGKANNIRFGAYGMECVFLYAQPLNLEGWTPESLKEFCLRDVLIHEIGHHVDRFRKVNTRASEVFADEFARSHG